MLFYKLKFDDPSGGHTKMIFSDKLRLLRNQAGLSQEGLADKLNVSRQSVSKWESGNFLSGN